jgi:hypothetical protein
MVFDTMKPSTRAMVTSFALAVISVGTVAGLLGGIGAGIYGAAVAAVGCGVTAWLLRRIPTDRRRDDRRRA